MVTIVLVVLIIFSCKRFSLNNYNYYAPSHSLYYIIIEIMTINTYVLSLANWTNIFVGKF